MVWFTTLNRLNSKVHSLGHALRSAALVEEVRQKHVQPERENQNRERQGLCGQEKTSFPSPKCILGWDSIESSAEGTGQQAIVHKKLYVWVYWMCYLPFVLPCCVQFLSQLDDHKISLGGFAVKVSFPGSWTGRGVHDAGLLVVVHTDLPKKRYGTSMFHELMITTTTL